MSESEQGGKIAGKLTDMKLSKYTYIIGAGHGGINPSTGEYVTSGKRSPKSDDGTVLYEGVNNRVNAHLIVKALRENGFSAVELLETWEDISLAERAIYVNNRPNNCIYIDIHSDAYAYRYIDKACTIRYEPNVHGKIPSSKLYRKHPSEWTHPRGITTFKYTNASKASSDFAKIVHSKLIDKLGHLTLDRKVKSANFHSLRETNCPAILLELGFHSNRQDVEIMKTNEWREGVVNAIVESVKIWEL